MKKLLRQFLLLFPLIALVFGSCEKGDDFYYDYQAEEKVYEGTIYAYLKSHKGVYDSLLRVLDRVPDLRRKLDNADSTLTLFAATNRSFEIAVGSLNTTRKLTGKAPLYLEDVKLEDLDSMVNRYVLNQPYYTETLAPFIDGQMVTSTKTDYKMHIQFQVLNASGFVGGGQRQLVFSDTNNSIFQRYWQRVNTLAVDVKTSNGVIHILSGGHDFGFNKFTSKYSAQ
ncbi:Fasciclin domain-containing protein [Sphingobacterium nematocida]|uniref:Fasciclin domain-containing protein n=1 Tax=Sphingobacterium nematocida TaxID=1513896 RepID=A0A1T5GGZ9_9SPHI|nr:fasciclin domain-containing protein [Sphingobacterium nematocida]SKC07693.1 Fasciclin domain-containing protein [Sphingobacterium nematocida]